MRSCAKANRILGMVLSREGHPGEPAAGAGLDAAGWSWTGSGEEAPWVIAGIGSPALSHSPN